MSKTKENDKPDEGQELIDCDGEEIFTNQNMMRLLLKIITGQVFLYFFLNLL